MAVVAIAGDDTVLVGQRGLKSNRDRLLADIEVTETADKSEPVKLPGLFLEPANEQHILVEPYELLLRCLVGLGLVGSFAIGLGRFGFTGGGFGHG